MKTAPGALHLKARFVLMGLSITDLFQAEQAALEA